MNASNLNAKPFLLFGALVVLAIWLGVVLATPMSRESLLLFAAVAGVIVLPLAFRYHQFALVALVNAPLQAFFVPGQPDLWVVVAFVSIGVSIFSWSVNRRLAPQWDIQIGLPLILLLAVVIITAMLRGGVGSRALGSGDWGGMRYVMVVSAIVVYFAISARPIQSDASKRFASSYVLSGVLSAISNLILVAGPAFYFLFAVFSSGMAALQIREGVFQRYTGVAWAASAVIYWMLLKFGVRGLTSFKAPLRLPVFGLLLLIALLGGFRSTLITIILILGFQFVFERLYRGVHLIAITCVGALLLAILGGLGDRLPISIQRSLSFLPIKVSAVAEADAAQTLDWRLEMWRVVAPDVPRYLWLGKGFSYSGADYYLTSMAVQEGRLAAYEDTLVSGNYHHGILTLIIPFGLLGFLAFVWFAAAGWWSLYRNYRQSPPELILLNTFLLSYYSARLLFYLTLYGQFDLDLIVFTSCVALGQAINLGHSSREARPTSPITSRSLPVVGPRAAVAGS